MRVGMRSRRSRIAGYTLIELMTTVAIVAILLGFAAPAFQEFIVNYRTSVQTNDLLADLALARSEAVKLARRSEVRAELGGWTNGWVVGTDLNADGNIDGDEIIKRHGPAEPDFTIVAGTVAGAPVASIIYGVTGTVVGPAGATNLEVAICRPDGDDARSRGIEISQSGRAASQQAADNATIRC
jgi:type IV fimbrial biogenesis protein FimT